jgi:hypothetical protein
MPDSHSMDFVEHVSSLVILASKVFNPPTHEPLLPTNPLAQP